MTSEIDDLFEARARAVGAGDRSSFLSTQVAEIELGSSDGYLVLKELAVEVLYEHDESDLEKVVLVRETYTRDEASTRSSVVLYYLTHTVAGWRIYRTK